MKGQGYYLKSRYPEIRLIQCLPTSNKGLNPSRGWHDGLPYPTKEGKLGGGLAVNLCVLACVFLLFPLISTLNKVFLSFQ